MENPDVHALENTSDCAIVDTLEDVITKMSQKTSQSMSSRCTRFSLNHNSLVTSTARVFSTDPRLRALDHSTVVDIPEHILRKVRSERCSDS